LVGKIIGLIKANDVRREEGKSRGNVLKELEKKDQGGTTRKNVQKRGLWGHDFNGPLVKEGG